MDTAHMMDSNLLKPITKLHIILFILWHIKTRTSNIYRATAYNTVSTHESERWRKNNL